MCVRIVARDDTAAYSREERATTTTSSSSSAAAARQQRGGRSSRCGVAALPGCRVAGVPGGVYNRTICRSLSRTREVRRSANQIGIPPLVHCHKMAALNQPDSAYRAPPPEAPLAARHEKLRLSIHFYRSCFSVPLSRSSLALTGTRAALLPEFRRAPDSPLFLPPAAVAFSSPFSSPPLSATPRLGSLFHLASSL